MPDVKFRYPDRALQGLAKAELIAAIQASVAKRLECLGYDEKPVSLTPDRIDVFLEPYEEEGVALGAVFVVEITAYGYPDRLASIASRLAAIGKDLARESWLGYYPFAKGRKSASLSYIPIPDGCWAAVD